VSDNIHQDSQIDVNVLVEIFEDIVIVDCRDKIYAFGAEWATVFPHHVLDVSFCHSAEFASDKAASTENTQIRHGLFPG